MLRYTGEDQMIKGLILSLQFFTRIPINIAVDFNSKNIKYSIFFLPLVGGIIGGLGALVYYILVPKNLLIAGFMTLLATIVLTGGLHLDGLSDTIDGFFSNRSKEKVLEIMQDSRIGAFGVLGIVLLVLFKFILIISIKDLPLAIILSFINSRLIASRMIVYKKTAKEEGLGKMFRDSNPKNLVFLSTLIYIVVLFIVDNSLLYPFAMTYLMAEYITYIANKKIGGLTGDVYGAIIELGDVVSLFTFWGVMMWI
nr:adenosylcobinamide-GDP ribazoletransferase [Tissierella sp.]